MTGPCVDRVIVGFRGELPMTDVVPPNVTVDDDVYVPAASRT
jgi:hypothetical protein